MAVSNYLTLAQVKAYMPNNEVSTTVTWDTAVTTLVGNLSRAFDKLTFRKPGAYAVTADVTRLFDGVPDTATDFTTSILIDELADVPTTVAVSMSGNNTFTPLALTDYYLWPYNAPDEGHPYRRIDLDTRNGQYTAWPTWPRSVQVVGKFGYSTSTPADVLEAMLLYAVRLIRKAQQNYLEVGTLLDSGQVMVGMKKDDDLQTLINYYKKSRI